MKNEKSYTSSILLSAASVMLMAPALRLFPSLAARLAGRGAWVSALAAFPVLAVYAWFLVRFASCAEAGEGAPELIERACGLRLGRAVLCVSSLWFLLYSAFILRAGADRLITTVYPNASPLFFIVITGALGIWAALGAIVTVERTAKLIEPMIAAVLAVILVSGALSADKAAIFPITVYDAVPILKGSAAAVDVISASLYGIFFISLCTEKRKSTLRGWLLWSAEACVFLCVLCIAVIGSFGAELAGGLVHPFFSLVRNLKVFGSRVRVDAFVVALWVFPDYVIFSAFLWMGQSCLRRAVLSDSPAHSEIPGAAPAGKCPRLDMRNGRWVIPTAGIAVIITAAVMAKDARTLALWSERLIPAINLAFAFVLLPAVYISGKARRKI